MTLTNTHIDTPQWFALAVSHELQAAELLAPYSQEILLPTEEIMTPGRRPRQLPLLAGVIFVRCYRDQLLNLEAEVKSNGGIPLSFTVCRYPETDTPIILTPRQVALLRQLTVTGSGKCSLYNKKEYNRNHPAKVISGPFEGYTGYIQRVQKNKHIVVPIATICTILLPFIPMESLEEFPHTIP